MLKDFITASQYAEEYAKNPDMFSMAVTAWETVLENMPKTYETGGEGDEAIAYIHYRHGDWHWYITELDLDTDGEGQLQAFGLVCGFERELGYIHIPELLSVGTRFDWYWKPIPLSQI